jgi:hypothetical protein
MRRKHEKIQSLDASKADHLVGGRKHTSTSFQDFLF